MAMFANCRFISNQHFSMKVALSLLSLILMGVPSLAQTSSSTGTQSGINQGAKEGSNSQNSGMMINLAAGGTLAAICATEGGAWACPMAAMAFLQAATQSAAKNQSDGVYDATQFQVPEYSSGDPLANSNITDPSLPSSPSGSTGGGNDLGNSSGFESSFGNPTINSQLAKLEDMGYKVNTSKGTVTTPKGEFPMKAFGSADAMAAAGMDPSQVSAARKGLAALNADLTEKYGDDAPKVVAMGVSGGLGGSSFGGELSEDGGDKGSDPMAAYLASLKKKLNQNRGPANVAGMQKMFGGEPIGVKMDNIFDMVHRRYQKKRKAKVFIE